MDKLHDKIKQLHPSIQKQAQKMYEEMNSSPELKNLGVESVFISESKRELSTQMAYYSRGRMDISDVKKMYKAAGLYTPTDEECKTPNTQTLNSKHIEGKAIDFVPVKNGNYWWNAPDTIWIEMGKIGKKYGFNWGGDWDWKDYPHFEV